jgi:preprotein translocase subunit SecF
LEVVGAQEPLPLQVEVLGKTLCSEMALVNQISHQLAAVMEQLAPAVLVLPAFMVALVVLVVARLRRIKAVGRVVAPAYRAKVIMAAMFNMLALDSLAQVVAVLVLLGLTD